MARASRLVRAAWAWLDRVDTTSPDVRRRARILLISLVATNLSSLSVSVVAVVFAPPGRKLATIVATLLLGLLTLLSVFVTRRGYVDAAGIIASGGLSAMLVLYQLYVGEYTAFLWFMTLSVVLGSISLRPKLIWVIGGENALLLVILAVLLPVDLAEKYRMSVMVGGLLLPTTVLTYYSASRIRETLLRQESTVAELERAKRELTAANLLLELRVAERTSDLGRKNAQLQETVTSLRQTQEQLVQSEKLAALGRIVSGVAHELRNPLNFINNFAELSLEYAGELERAASSADGGCTALVSDVLPDLANNLRRIHAHGLRAESIIDAMQLHGWRAKDDDYETLDGRVAFNDFVRESCAVALDDFRARHPLFDCEVREQFCHDIVGSWATPGVLARVIFNLIDNACYAMLARTKEDPSHRPVLDVRTTIRERSTVLEVLDNGIGIPENLRLNIFDPFFTTKPPGEGTGLGLSISYELVVKQLGGRLEVEPRAQGGAVFRVMLAIAASAADADATR